LEKSKKVSKNEELKITQKSYEQNKFYEIEQKQKSAYFRHIFVTQA
jgi:hypothetical protein